jgi:hypothetical protein
MTLIISPGSYERFTKKQGCENLAIIWGARTFADIMGCYNFFNQNLFRADRRTNAFYGLIGIYAGDKKEQCALVNLGANQN